MIFTITLIIYIVVLFIMGFVAISAITQLWSYRIPGSRHILGITWLSVMFFILIAFSLGTFFNVPWGEVDTLIFDNSLSL